MMPAKVVHIHVWLHICFQVSDSASVSINASVSVSVSVSISDSVHVHGHVLKVVHWNFAHELNMDTDTDKGIHRSLDMDMFMCESCPAYFQRTTFNTLQYLRVYKDNF